MWIFCVQTLISSVVIDLRCADMCELNILSVRFIELAHHHANRLQWKWIFMFVKLNRIVELMRYVYWSEENLSSHLHQHWKSSLFRLFFMYFILCNVVLVMMCMSLCVSYEQWNYGDSFNFIRSMSNWKEMM